MSAQTPSAPQSSSEPSLDTAMNDFRAYIEAQRVETEAKFGFVHSGPPRGHWRFLLLLGQGVGLKRPAVEASWDNATAQAMAMRLLDLPGEELPLWASSQGVCDMLGLRFLMTASEIIDTRGWAESPGSHQGDQERLPSESNSACALWMEDDDNVEPANLAAGLVRALAQATGGVFKSSAVEPMDLPEGWKEALDALTAPFDFNALPQRVFSASHARDLEKITLHLDPGGRPESVWIDLRAAARVMGCPLRVSLAAPDHHHLLCWDRILTEVRTQLRNDPIAFQSAFADCIAPVNGGLDILAARQEAAILNQAALAASPAKTRPRV